MKFGFIREKILVSLSALFILSSCRDASLPSKVEEVIIPTTLVTKIIPESTTEHPTMTTEPPDSIQTPVHQADADVIYVRAVFDDQRWTFHVTVSHPDIGWDDYVNGWDLVTPDGKVLKVNESDPFTRLLLHPHENEQPFTRSQSGIKIPEGTSIVRVRAHDLVDGFGGKEIIVDLNQKSGDGFEIIK